MKSVRNSVVYLLTLMVLFLSLVPVAGQTSQRPRSSAQTEVWRRRAPKATAARPFHLPPIREIKLENGLTVVLIEDRRSPMVTFSMGIPVGTANDPIDGRGLAEAVAELLTEGAGPRNSEQLAREIETLGAQIGVSANDDFTELSGSVVSENAERALEIIGDVLVRPTFPEGEVALYKENRVQNLTVQRQEPAFLVSEHFNRIVYGPHPYSISAPTPESLIAMDRTKIERFYRSNFTPLGSVLVIVGDFDVSKIAAKSKEVLGPWKPVRNRTSEFPALPTRSARRVYLMDRPGSEQADFRIGNLAVARSDPDYFPLIVANTVLGGGTSSRLFLNIRERKGYAYDVGSSVSAPLRRGTFFGSSETRTEVALSAIKEMLAEFSRIRNIRVTPLDLLNAKTYLNGVFSLTLSTQGGIARRVLQRYMLGLPKDYLETYRSRIEAVTAAQVQQAARKYILTDKPAIVVVGDAAKLKSQLKVLGPVEVVSIEGKPVE